MPYVDVGTYGNRLGGAIGADITAATQAGGRGINWFPLSNVPDLDRYTSPLYDEIGGLQQYGDGSEMNDYVQNKLVKGLYYPSWNGGLSLGEANWHWRKGDGASLVIDISTLDLSNVPNLPQSGQVNFAGRNFSSLNDAAVYGTVALMPGPNNTVIGGFDYYNFDIKTWSTKTFSRNISTITGRIIAGPGTPYRIEFTGIAPLGNQR